VNDYTSTYRTLLSLFDYTGEWSQPFYDAGWNVIQWDIQLDEFMDINLLDSAETVLDQFDSVDGIIAALPCTDFACSGARWFAAKDASGQTEASVEMARQVMRLVDLFEPTDWEYEGTFFWAIENPVGRLQKLTGLPVQEYFQPYEYAGWLNITPEELAELDRIRKKEGIGVTAEEAELILRTNTYTKKTGLWGSFNSPDKKPIEPVKGSPQGSVMQRFGGKSEKTKNIRSATPKGFALAFYEANKNKVWQPEDLIIESEEIEIETEKKSEMSYKIKTLIDNGLVITKLPKENQEDIETISILSDGYKTDNEDAKKLDKLLVAALESKGLTPSAKKSESKSKVAYLFAQTVSGEGYSDPEFEVFSNIEDAFAKRDEIIKSSKNMGVEIDQSNPMDVYIEDGEDSIASDTIRIQVIPLDFPEKYFIVKYTEPNEVEIIEKYDKKGSADLSLDMLVTTADWEDEDILEDEEWEKGQQSFGEHAEDGFLWYGVFANAGAGAVIKNKKYDPSKLPLYKDSKGNQYHEVHASSKDTPGTYLEKGVAVFIDEKGIFRPSEIEKTKISSKTFKEGQLTKVEQSKPKKSAEVDDKFMQLRTLFDRHVNNGGDLSYPEKDYTYVLEDLENIEIGWYGIQPDGSYMEELAAQGYSVNEKEALEILNTRISNTKEAIEGSKPKIKSTKSESPHGESGHFNTLVKDQDSIVTGYGKHDRIVVSRDPDSGNFTARIDKKWNLGMPTDEQIMVVAKEDWSDEMKGKTWKVDRSTKQSDDTSTWIDIVSKKAPTKAEMEKQFGKEFMESKDKGNLKEYSEKKPSTKKPEKSKSLSETTLSKTLIGKKIYFQSDNKNWIEGMIVDVIPQYKNEKDKWRLEFYPKGGKSELEKPIVSDVLTSEQVEKFIDGEDVKGYTRTKPKSKVISDFETASKEIDECLEQSKTERAEMAKDKNKPPKKTAPTIVKEKSESYIRSMVKVAETQKPDKAAQIKKILEKAEADIKKILFG